MGVQRYRSKPRPATISGMFAAKYEPGQPLDDLIRVARMAGSDAEVAEAPLPSGTVLVARWRRYPEEGPSKLEYEVVRAGDYLTYSESYGSLNPADDAELRRWYEPDG